MPPKQLPVYSPVTVGSVAAALTASVVGGARARARVEALVRQEYAPRELLLVDSGTSALTLALTAIRRAAEAAGREPLVALPAYGCFDLATAAVGAQVSVVLYDLDPATLGPAWPSLDEALGRAPVAIVVAHLYGVPADVSRVAAKAAAVDATVVDDAAQGVGASIGDRPVGAFGSLGVLSFGRGKGRTGGGGGALLANDERGAALLARVRNDIGAAPQGLKAAVLLKAQWLFGRPSLYWIPASLPFLKLGDSPYRPPHLPAAISDSCAAALAVAWDHSMGEVPCRRAVAAAWRRDAMVQGWRFPESEAEHAMRGELRLPAILPPGLLASEVVAQLGGGVMPGYPMPLAGLPALTGRLAHREATPGAEVLVRRLVTLPCHRHVRR